MPPQLEYNLIETVGRGKKCQGARKCEEKFHFSGIEKHECVFDENVSSNMLGLPDSSDLN